MSLPMIPNEHALAVLVLTLVALVLFMRERVPLETSSLTVLALLLIGFELFPLRADDGTLRGVDFLAGFGHPALIAVSALMIAGQGLMRTGALDPAGRWLARNWLSHPRLALLGMMLSIAVVSAFVNNTPLVVLSLPLLVSVATRAKVPAAKMLMPVGFATLIGGMATTIGTSTNLLVVSVAADMGMPPVHIFDFALPAVIAGSAGILYLWLIAPRLLPAREAPSRDRSPRTFAAQLSVADDSPFAGKPLAEALAKTGGAMKVDRIQRHSENPHGEGPHGDNPRGGSLVVPLPDVTLQAGDRLRVADTPDNLKEFEAVLGVRMEVDASTQSVSLPANDATAEAQMTEVVIGPGSPLDGTTLNDLRFCERYRLVALALHRAGKPMPTETKGLGDVMLRTGDVLLVEGQRDDIDELRRRGELLVLDAGAEVPYTRKAPIALAIMAAIVGFAAAGILPIAVSAVIGVLLMVVTGCLSWRNAAAALNPAVILLIAASLALGTALVKTGAAQYIAELFVALTQGASPAWILSGLMGMMAIFTNVIANNAAGVIGTPIAIAIARQLNLPPEPFVLAVLFGANMGFAIPTETNLLVLNAGRYRFNDFVRVGVPLTVIMWAAFSLVLPRLYGL